ncbi:MAG: exopolysaccharide biosynthesis polyprenyl glycosylphosphotransferase [bacterium]
MKKVRILIMIFLDGVAWYAAFLAMLFVRYPFSDIRENLLIHIGLFSALFLLWLLLFYIAGLYQSHVHKSASHLFRVFLPTISVGVFVSIIIFYISAPLFLLTPKTNLILFVFFFGLIDFCIRVVEIKFFITYGARTKIILAGDTPELAIVAAYIEENPYLGYELVYCSPSADEHKICAMLGSDCFRESDVVVVALPLIRKDGMVQRVIYETILPSQKEFFDSVTFYEMLFQKVPIEVIQEYWFVEKVASKNKVYGSYERMFDCSLAILLLGLFSPIFCMVAILIKCTSRGRIIYKQVRVGKGGTYFTLYKFRTMKMDAEKNGPQWAQKDDPRTTMIGKLLRFTHVDELPQLFNILKGDLSFVGPRPERPEFVKELRKHIPYYDVRHIVKPGLTGWSQINYRYGSSIEDAREKLKYDIYYLKEKSFIFNLLIIIKTIKFFIFNM